MEWVDGGGGEEYKILSTPRSIEQKEEENVEKYLLLLSVLFLVLYLFYLHDAIVLGLD